MSLRVWSITRRLMHCIVIPLRSLCLISSRKPALRSFHCHHAAASHNARLMWVTRQNRGSAGQIDRSKRLEATDYAGPPFLCDTIRDAISTCAQQQTVSLVYRTEPKTKRNGKTLTNVFFLAVISLKYALLAS